jgi:acyl-CoA synthetase (AMP-forming)/AMP-acid ligase II
MGLIGNVLQPLFAGARCVLMSPYTFLQQPYRWLEAITRYRATTSGGPNFAYELCVRRIGEEQRAALDLSSWRVAFNGAEPVRAETLERFARAFAPCGFRRQAFYPCYGLAEATLFVSGGEPGAGERVERVEPAALERGLAAPSPEREGGRPLVSCGRVWGGQEAAVVDPATGEPCGEGQVGEIWLRGPSVTQGYWSNAAATARDFGASLRGPAGPQGPYLRTGDLGFLSGGELFVTGRSKDLIILRGRNLYPQDVELTVERSHPALRPGGAAFAVDAEGEERLIVVQEVERRARDLDAVAGAVRRAVSEEHEARVWDVVLVKEGTVPRTSSGKIQRHACRAGYLAGTLAVAGRSALAAGAGEEAVEAVEDVG